MYRHAADPDLPFSLPPVAPRRTYIRHGYGQVGTGATPEEAQAALFEMIRQARER